MTASSTWEFMTTFPFLPEALRLCGDQHSCAGRERPPDTNLLVGATAAITASVGDPFAE